MTNKIELFGTVGETITVDQVRSFLNENKANDVQFNISSLGGDLDTALTIYNLIKSFPNKTTANIIGLTASAGTVIADACESVVMSDNALFLIHNGWIPVEGNVYDMQKAVKELAKTDAIMIKIYREKTGLSDAKITDLMKAADWLSPQESLDYGFVDSLFSTGNKIAASAIITEAQNGKINDLLLTKLKEKMNIFGKKDKKVLNVLALKDGKQCLVEGEAAVGSEVAPLGATSLEDGEYELTDGRKITVAGGVITNITDPAATAAAVAATTDEVVAAVAALVDTKLSALEAKVTAQLAAIKSTHIPAKGTGIAVQTASAHVKPEVSEKINETVKAIHDEIAKARKD
jgi:ATP-dependent protease ClpP protease subunit